MSPKYYQAASWVGIPSMIPVLTRNVSHSDNFGKPVSAGAGQDGLERTRRGAGYRRRSDFLSSRRGAPVDFFRRRRG